jgi:hypothetical protein
MDGGVTRRAARACAGEGTMDKSAWQSTLAAGAVSSTLALIGPGCALAPGEAADRAGATKDEASISSVEEGALYDEPTFDDSGACASAPNLRGCGQTHRRRGYPNVLYSCQNGVVVRREYFPGGCVHQDYPYPDLCYEM